MSWIWSNLVSFFRSILMSSDIGLDLIRPQGLISSRPHSFARYSTAALPFESVEQAQRNSVKFLGKR